MCADQCCFFFFFASHASAVTSSPYSDLHIRSNPQNPNGLYEHGSRCFLKSPITSRKSPISVIVNINAFQIPEINSFSSLWLHLRHNLCPPVGPGYSWWLCKWAYQDPLKHASLLWLFLSLLVSRIMLLVVALPESLNLSAHSKDVPLLDGPSSFNCVVVLQTFFSHIRCFCSCQCTVLLI